MPSIRNVMKNEDYFAYKDVYPSTSRHAIAHKSNHVEVVTPIIQSDFWVWFWNIFPKSPEGANCEINMYWCDAAEHWKSETQTACVIADVTTVYHMHLKTSHSTWKEHRWGGKYAKDCAERAKKSLNFKQVYDYQVVTSPIGFEGG